MKIFLEKVKYKALFFFLFHQAVDWWSLGVLFYELVTGASPFTVEGSKNTQPEISRSVISIHQIYFTVATVSKERTDP